MRIRNGLWAAALAASFLAACDDDPQPPAKQLAIIQPENGEEIAFSDDSAPGLEGLNFTVLVEGVNLVAGDVVTLTAGDASAQEEFGANPITFRDFNLGTSPGEVTLVAAVGDIESPPITVTLVDACPRAEIVTPADGARLRTEDDADPDEPGFQHDITASTNAERGSTAVLYVEGGATANEVEVTGPTVVFDNVTMSEGEVDYEVRIEGHEECSSGAVTITVDTVAPACDIVLPASDVSILNIAADGDPVAAGMQTDFQVETDSGLEITVTLYVNDRPAAQDVTSSGLVSFDDVDLAEGDREVHATCVDLANNQGVSVTRAFTVDTTLPDLTIESPVAGASFNPQDDALDAVAGLQFRVQLRSTSADAAEACAFLDGAAPLDTYGCADVVGGEAELFVDAPSPGTFELVVTLDDENGNRQEARVEDIRIDVAGAAVVIVTPATDAVLNIASDLDASEADLQVDVVACSDEAGTGVLRSDSADVASVEAVASPCPDDSAMGYTLRYNGITLGQGAQNLTVVFTDSARNETSSPAVAVVVDTIAPELAIASPGAGEFINEADDAQAGMDGVQFLVRVTGSNADTVGQLACASLEGAAPLAEPLGCAALDGSLDLYVGATINGPANVVATLTDIHGNSTEARVGVTIDVDIPTVFITAPAHLEVLNMADDLDPVARDLQYNVIACASEAGSARLLDGTRGIAVADAMATPCPASAPTQPYTITFANATLSQGDRTLSVEFTDGADNTSTSPAITVTVDTVPPTCVFFDPACGSTISSFDVPRDVTVIISHMSTLTVTDSGGATIFEASGSPRPGGSYTFVDVPFETENNSMVCSATDEHDNTFATPPCPVIVENTYLLEITTPLDGALLGSAADTDPGAGYSIQVCVRSTSIPSGSEQVVAEVDGVEATRATFLSPTTCMNVALTGGDHAIRVWVDVDGDGAVDAEDAVNVTIDLTPPGPVTALSAVVLDRRESSIRVMWTAPADEAAASHRVAWSHDPITNDAEFASAHQETWTGGSTPAGAPVTFDIHNLAIERDYYIAVKAVDAGGTPGPIAALAVPIRPAFAVQITPNGVDGSVLGLSLSGAGDLDGDDVDDFVAGSTMNGYVYFGPVTAATPWTPGTTFALPGGRATMAGVGDFNGDGDPDLAIGAPLENAGVGSIYIYFGGAGRTWFAAMNDGDADVVVNGVASGGNFGTTVVGVGDFCGDASGGDGYMDIAASAPMANGRQGYAYVVCGGAIATGTTVNVDSPGVLTVLRIDGVLASASPNPSMGVSMTGLGDINGDGLDDLAVSHFRLTVGEVYVVRGLPSATISAESPLAASNATRVQTIVGTGAADDFFGYALAGAGDIDDDGFADLAVASIQNDDAGANAGLVSIYLSSGDWFDTTRAILFPDWPDAAGDRFGNGIARDGAGWGGAPDRSLSSIDGIDDVADLLVVSRKRGPTNSSVGRIAVLYGAAGVVDSGLELLTSELEDDLATPESQDGAGFIRAGESDAVSMDYVVFGGDLNDDGYEDFVVANSEISSWSGRLSVYY